MLQGNISKLSSALALARTLELVASDEGFIKQNIAHAFADLLLFAANKNIKIEAVPTWSGLQSYLDLNTAQIKVWTEDLSVDFESLLEACSKETAPMISLDTRQLKLAWKKAIPVPMAPGELVICFDLISKIPEDYREALRAAGSLKETFTPGTTSETISCPVGNEEIPF